MNKSRLEAFSDGVFAIAVTLLVLDLHVPARDVLRGSLAHALATQWPAYAAYVTSFLIIGIIWINHHAVFRLVRTIDRPVLFVNLLLLMVVSAIPFPTSLFAEYLTAGRDARTAAVIYSAVMLAMAVAFTGLYLLVTRPAATLADDVDPAAVRAMRGRFGVGVIVYVFTVVVAFLNAPLCLATHFVIAAYYAFEQAVPRRRGRS